MKTQKKAAGKADGVVLNGKRKINRLGVMQRYKVSFAQGTPIVRSRKPGK
jgi:hypothetical protein